MNIFDRIPKPLRRLVSLYIEDARLAVTQRLTIVLSSLIVGLIVTLLLVAAIIFISIACAFELRQVMSPALAYAVVALFYVFILCVVIIFRKALIINPISRLLSKSILSAPKSNDNENKTI